ncbi:MAG TPA: N-acetyltransferase [Desulfobacteraceae bacterium]|nr:N-acetyltransferase [Desulfobacteraceae bacterium]
MIRRCDKWDFDAIYSIINEAAVAYEGVIPEDCWKVPYMSKEELNHEIEEGVVFWGYEENGKLIGVMGNQPVQDVVLIRHAYVLPVEQRRGIGGKLLNILLNQIHKPVLIGTWSNAFWAIRFYEKYGFRLVPQEEKDRLLRKYWSIPDLQIHNSVVLADERWFRYRKMA